MPQKDSAKKALRSNEKKRAANDRWRRKLHGALLEIRNALRDHKKDAATTAYTKAQSIIDRATRHNIIHPNTAARKKSRILQSIAKLK